MCCVWVVPFFFFFFFCCFMVFNVCVQRLNTVKHMNMSGYSDCFCHPSGNFANHLFEYLHHYHPSVFSFHSMGCKVLF